MRGRVRPTASFYFPGLVIRARAVDRCAVDADREAWAPERASHARVLCHDFVARLAIEYAKRDVDDGWFTHHGWVRCRWMVCDGESSAALAAAQRDARTHARTHTYISIYTMPPKPEVKKDKLTDAEKKKQKQANKVRAWTTRFGPQTRRRECVTND